MSKVCARENYDYKVTSVRKGKKLSRERVN